MKVQHDSPSASGERLRRIARLLVVLASAGLLAHLLLFFDLSDRGPLLFKTVGFPEASASESTRADLAKLRLLSRCVGHVRSSYVAPQRVKPLPMLVGALKAAEALVPDLMVTTDSAEPEKATSVVVRVGDQQKTFDLSHVSDLFEMNWKLLDIFEFIAAYLPSDIKPEDVEYAAINGMLSPLDEHSVYLPPRAYREMQLDTQGRFGGLGIVITTRKGLVTVVSVLPGTPAAKAGLKFGDQILEIGDESTVNMNLSDAVSKLRGEPGTTVNVLITRKEWSEPRSFQLTRAEIHIQSVVSEALGDGIGYARIRHFQEDTTRELKRQLEDLKARHSLKGLVLDLRQNPGGLLEQAVEVGRLFIRRGVIVTTEGEGRRRRQEYEATDSAPFGNLPMVVLVDQGSASAAEIVAGAIKGNDRAPLVGTTTFGKGTVQVMYEVGDGALKLTVAQYLMPDDISIQGVGIRPDLELLPVSVGAERISMSAGGERRDRDPQRMLDAFGKVANDQPKARVRFLVSNRDEDQNEDDEEPPIRDEDKFERDEAIDFAARLLGEIRSPTRRSALTEAQGALKAWVEEQDSRISAALAQKGVDWTAGPVQPAPPLRVNFGMDRPEPLHAGTKVKLRLTMRNEGTEPLFRVHAVTESESSALDDREFVFGRIGPGETATREVQVTIPKNSWDRTDQVEFRVFQGDQEAARPDPVLVSVVSAPRPRFAYSFQVQDPNGNGDGVLNVGESVNLILDIQNLGEGDAGKVLATLRNKSGDGVYIRNGRAILRDGIPVGRTAQAKFSLDLRRATTVTLEVGILDLGLNEYLSDEVTIPISRPGPERFETYTGALRTVRPGVKVMAGASLDAPVLFEMPENFFLRAIGRRSDWFKVDLEEQRFAFVRASDVEPILSVVRMSPLPEAPMPQGVAPAVEVKPGQAERGDTAWLSGQVRFAGHPGEARRKVLIFRGNDKVYFWTRKGPTNSAVVPVDAQVPLLKGRNDIAIYAIEGKNLSGVRRFTLFWAGEQAAARAAGQRGGIGR